LRLFLSFVNRKLGNGYVAVVMEAGRMHLGGSVTFLSHRGAKKLRTDCNVHPSQLRVTIVISSPSPIPL